MTFAFLLLLVWAQGSIISNKKDLTEEPKKSERIINAWSYLNSCRMEKIWELFSVALKERHPGRGNSKRLICLRPDVELSVNTGHYPTA